MTRLLTQPPCSFGESEEQHEEASEDSQSDQDSDQFDSDGKLTYNLPAERKNRIVQYYMQGYSVDVITSLIWRSKTSKEEVEKFLHCFKLNLLNQIDRVIVPTDSHEQFTVYEVDVDKQIYREFFEYDVETQVNQESTWTFFARLGLDPQRIRQIMELTYEKGDPKTQVGQARGSGVNLKNYSEFWAEAVNEIGRALLPYLNHPYNPTDMLDIFEVDM